MTKIPKMIKPSHTQSAIWHCLRICSHWHELFMWTIRTNLHERKYSCRSLCHI